MNKRSKITTYISKKIKALRKSVDWSQADLARQSRINYVTIHKLERGDRMPSIDVCLKLSKAFNVPIAELTGYTSISSKDINDKAQVFFRKFCGINKLTKPDQKLLLSIIDRMSNER
jgi:transcriptional regulator with XRE-family HTH domain